MENAEAFKLEYTEGGNRKEKEFATLKALEQFHNRQRSFSYLELNRYAFVNNKWHLFIKLNSPFVFARELDFINKIFHEKVEEKHLQRLKIED